MNEIQSGTVSVAVPYDAAQPSVADVVAASISPAQIAALQQRIVEWVRQADTQQSEGMAGVSDANGAPAIDGVAIDFSAEGLGDALRLLGTKSQEARLRTAKEGLENSKLKLDETHRANIQKIEEYARKYAESNEANKASSIFGWIAKAFAFLAALVAVAVTAVATVATGGAAAPALALAAVGLAAATMSMASAISQEAGGPPLELSSLLTSAVSAVLVECGMPKERADSIGKVASGVLAIVAGAGASLLLDPTLLANVVGGSMELSGVDAATVASVTMAVTIATAVVVGIASAALTMGASTIAAVGNATTQASSLTKAADLAGKVGTMVQGASMVVAGAASIGSGAEKIISAEARNEADTVSADQKRLQAITTALMRAMEEDGEEIKKVIKEIEDAVQAISNLVADAAQNISTITTNIGGRSTV